MASWLNLNDSLQNIKGQLSNFANNVLAEDDAGNQSNDLEELKKICVRQELEIQNLKKVNEELNQNYQNFKQNNSAGDDWDGWDNEDATLSNDGDPQSTISSLKFEIEHLRQEKLDLIQQLDQLDSDHQQTLNSVVKMKEKLQEENTTMKNNINKLEEARESELENSKKEITTLQKILEDTKLAGEAEIRDFEARTKKLETDKEILVGKLESANQVIEEYNLKNLDEENYKNQVVQAVQVENEKLLLQKSSNTTLQKILEDTKLAGEAEIRDFEARTKKLEFDREILVAKLESANQVIKEYNLKNLEDEENYKNQVGSLREELHAVQVENEKLLLQNSNKENFVDIINENVHKFLNISINTSDEFRPQIENTFKIFVEYKEKCEDLENQVSDISQKLTEKNLEFDKLVGKCKRLHQDVFDKDETINEYEREFNILQKNNEFMMSELEHTKKRMKNSPDLDTISEINEDKLCVLETMLETANNRIEDLEKIIDDGDTVVNETNEKQEFTEDEIPQKEVKELKLELERKQSDIESIEYQISEMKINTESLQEEIGILIKENQKLKSLYEDSEKQKEDISNKLESTQQHVLLLEKSSEEMNKQIETLTQKLQNSKMAETSLKLQYDTLNKEINAISEIKSNLEISLSETNKNLEQFQNNFLELQQENDELKEKYSGLKRLHVEKDTKISNLEKLSQELKSKTDDNSITELKNQLTLEINEKMESEHVQQISQLQKQIEEINNSRTELINMVTTKHQESITYHNEIQRLSQLLQLETEKSVNLEQQIQQLSTTEDILKKQQEQIEKLSDQNNFLKEKCEILTQNLLEEQSKIQKLLSEKSTMVSEKEIALSKEVKRLQAHLIEIEEHSTQELLQAEQRNNELQTKMNEIEQREKNTSTMYTSVSIRANQQAEVLQNQLQMVINQREELRKKISDAEDQNIKQSAALANLQFVLEQFRKDKEKDVKTETERIRRQIDQERKIQDDLKNEIVNLKSQLEESKQGLQAASRLSDQLEQSKRLVVSLKEEVNQLQQKIQKTEEQLESLSCQTDGKVDKSLIKNLIIGFVSSNNNNTNKDQTQILKIIATVLDFNQQDHDKVKLNKPQEGHSWWSSLLTPQAGQNMSQESLSQAFVRFLENESKPMVVPSLLESKTTESSRNSTSVGSKPASSRQSPIVLSEIVLPTFADFAQNRNSSSILKDVLKDNTT